MNGSATLDMIEAPDRARVALHPLRSRILDALKEPDSAAGLSRRLELPRQKVNYHVRELEKHGLVEAVDERRRGNCVERIVRATARAYLISPSALGRLAADPEAIEDHLSSSYLLALAGQAIRDLTTMRPAARESEKRLATLALQSEIRFATPESRAAFARELANHLTVLIAKYHDEFAPGGRRFRLFLAAYPVVDGAGGGAVPAVG